MSDEEQVIVSKGVGVVQPKEEAKPDEPTLGVDPSWKGMPDLKRAVNEAKKRQAPKPLPTETIIGAAIRVQLCTVLGFGPLTSERVEWMCNIVEESLPLIQTTMGLKVRRPASPLPRGAIAGVKTVLGMIPLTEWCSAWGTGDGGQFRRAKTIAKVAFRRAKEKFLDTTDAAIVAEEGKDLDQVLRARIVALLDQPYTMPVAKRLEKLLGAIPPLLQALGPARDRVKHGRKVQAGNYGTYSPGSQVSSYMPLTPGEDPNVALVTEQFEADPAFSMASFQSALYGSSTPSAGPTAAALADLDQVGLGGSVDDDDNEDAPPLVASPPIETFGAKIIREIMAMAPVLMNAQRNTPENMVLAIVAAEREGMPKLAAKLRKLMGVDKADEQETPKPAFRGISAFVMPETPADETTCYDACGNTAKKIGKDHHGFLHPYCEKDYAVRLKSGFLVEECAGGPECGVKGEKPGVNVEGLTSLYCEHHHNEALRLGDVVDGSAVAP